MQKSWNYLPKPQSLEISDLADSLNINPSLAAILIQRGITGFEEAKDYFRPSLKHLHPPLLMKDMKKAVDRLMTAIHNKENILIYGDYDVDGTTSVSMMMSFLRRLHSSLSFYIPDRYSEGYGISRQGIEWAKSRGISLMISLDCGIRAIDTVDLAGSYDIDVIICDHHRPGDKPPAAFAILDPKQEDCDYPYKELSGCGVGFKLLEGLTNQMKLPPENLHDLLDLVAVSIASDIVPITGENRILAYHGLQKLNRQPRPGFDALMQVGNMKRPLSIGNIVFGIAPRINAAGRMAHAHGAVELLSSPDLFEAIRMAGSLNTNNEMRKETDKDITMEALEMIRSDSRLQEAKTTVLYQEHWHKGVIGIVASKCIEHFHRPTIILTQSEGKATGSARSVPGFDIHQAIAACDELLEQFGGHKYAAGLTLPLKNLQAFRKKFESVVSSTITPEQLTPQLTISQFLPLDQISMNFVEVIDQMEPFGPGNMRPIFATRNLVAAEARLLKGEHIKMQVLDENDGVVFDAIGFNMPEHFDKLTDHAHFNLAYTVEKNTFRGKSNVQLMIKDIKFDPSNHDTES